MVCVVIGDLETIVLLGRLCCDPDSQTGNAGSLGVARHVLLRQLVPDERSSLCIAAADRLRQSGWPLPSRADLPDGRGLVS